MPKYTVHIVPHTHWDREWYSPFQRYRMRLVHLLDKLLDILEKDPDYKVFTLDGQAIPIVDYLEIRPEKRTLIQQMVTAKRLLIGPWYILPDEFLVSGEAHVRNLMLGHRIAQEFGFVPKMGYIPDTFGHISQLPQILQGFGIDNAMLWRGLSRPGLKSELWWEAPDGTRVLLHHLLSFTGYSNAGPMPADFERAEAYLKSLIRTQQQRATTSHLLVQNGVDHLEPRPDLPMLIRFLNERAAARGEDVHYVHSSVLDYITAVKAEIEPTALEVVRSELRSTNFVPEGGQIVLPNVLSARIYNKIQNADAQQALERWAEPWCAFLWTLGEEYPQGFLWRAWDWLIQNHPHDSIGGCSVDEVHAQMETRFQWAQEIADNLADERFRLLAARLDLSWLEDDEFAVVVFNGLGWDLSDTVTVNLDVPYNFWARLALQRAQPLREWDEHSDFLDVWRWETWRDWAGDPPVLPDLGFKGLLLHTMDGLEVPAEIEDVTTTVVGQNLLSGPRAAQSVLRIRASFPVQALPPCGYQVLAGRLTAQPIKHDMPRHPANVMENEHLRVEIQSNGTLCVTDKATGQRYTDLGYFEDGGDCGDGYNYSYPPHDAVFNTLSARPRVARLSDGPVVQRYRIEYDLELPAGLTDDRKRRRADTVHCPLTVIVSLGAHARRVDFEATLENRARDHRLRVIFPSDVPTEISYSEAQFDVVPHPVHPKQPSREVWWEDQPVTYPQQTFVDVSNGQRGLCVMSHGLPEYEVVNSPRREIAITLLRAVAYLGAGDDLYTIRSGAGPRIPTPGGQCLRTLTYRYAIMPHAGTWEQAEVWREAHAHSVRPRAIVAVKHPDFPVPIAPAPTGVTLPRDRHSFLSVTGRNAVLSAVKRAEREDALIVRLFNPSTEPTTATVRFACVLAGAELVNLNEEPLGEPLAIDSTYRVNVTLAPKRIVTIKATLAQTRG